MAAESQQSRRGTPVPSQTQTITNLPSQTTGTQAILRLRGAHDPSQRRIQWAEDVVDNEGLGRKKSKVCCIYHRPKAVDESSDESSSDSSDSSSDESDFGGDGGRRKIPSGDGKGKGKGKGHKCHDHDHDHNHSGRPARKRQGEGDGDDKDKEKRRPSPNAYERVPKPPSKPKAATTNP